MHFLLCEQFVNRKLGLQLSTPGSLSAPHQNQWAQTLTASSLLPSILWWSLGFLQVLAHLVLSMQAFTEVGKFDSKVAPLFSIFLATLVQL